MAKKKVSRQTYDKEMKRLQTELCALQGMVPYKKQPFDLGPVPERRARGPNSPDEITFKHSVPKLF